MAPDGAGDGTAETAAGGEAPGAQADGERNGNRSELGPRTGLLVDWGGVLTTNLFESFKAFCVRRGIAPEKLRESFGANPDFRELLVALEKGELGEEVFEARLAPLLGIEPDGLIDGLFAGVHADEAMLDAVRRAREAGVRTGLISNSWGVHRYPHELFGELFDGVVISGEEGIRKPSRRMYELGAERAGVAAQECVYVDDLAFNLEPAENLGMVTIHHTDAAITIPELERLLGIELSG
jgi:epoxide hydrolase-like predicted phosphatase